MPVHRRITALLAALTTMAGGSFVATAAADADTDAERGPRAALTATSSPHAAAHRAHADALASALGVSDERLGVVLRELRSERRPSDVVGARPAVRTPAELAAQRDRYVAALAAKVGVAPEVAAAALDGVDPRSRTGTG